MKGYTEQAVEQANKLADVAEVLRAEGNERLALTVRDGATLLDQTARWIKKMDGWLHMAQRERDAARRAHVQTVEQRDTLLRHLYRIEEQTGYARNMIGEIANKT